MYIRADANYNPKEAFSGDDELRYRIAQHTESQELLELYAYDPSADVRWAVADNPHTPAELLEYLSDDEDIWPRIGVASNDNTPLHILEKLSDDINASVRQKVASNENTPDSVLNKLADTDHYGILDAITDNPNASAETLDKIAKTPKQYESILINVAYRQTTASGTLAYLATNGYAPLRKAVAYHSKTPDDILMQLADDPDSQVANTARFTLRDRGLL